MAFIIACNLFAGDQVLERKEVNAIDKLRCTASWDGTSAGRCNRTAHYTTPDGWRIVDHKVTTRSDNNGSKSVSILDGGRRLRAEVSAKAHGSAFDRKRGWMEISVRATLEKIPEPPVEEPETVNVVEDAEEDSTPVNPPSNGNDSGFPNLPDESPDSINLYIWIPIIVALIGAIATIIAAWVGRKGKS
jgi:hypothetical protein